MHTILSALLVSMLFSGAVDSATPSPLSDTKADALFSAVQQQAIAWAYPRYAAYHVAVTFTIIFSRQDASNPHTPHGINADIPLIGNLSPPDKQRDPLGEICLAADQTFGIAQPRHYTVVQDRQAFANVVQQYCVIGRTQSDRWRRYALAILESTSTVVHLDLTPLIDPRRDRNSILTRSLFGRF